MSDINEVTKGWQTCKLKDVGTIINGDRGKNYPSRAHYVTSGVPFISAGNIEEYFLDTDSLNYISEEKFDALNSGKLLKGDIIYCLRGSLGKCAIFGLEKGAISSSLCILRLNKDMIDKFVYYYLQSPFGKSEILKHDNGTAQPNLSAKSFSNYEIYKPSLQKQQAIVSKIEELFSELDKSIEQLKKAQQQLKVYRQSVLKRAFDGKLTEEWRCHQANLISSKSLLETIKSEQQEEFEKLGKKLKPVPEINAEELEGLGRLPYGWRWCRLGDIVWSVKDGPHYSPKYQAEGVPFISGGNIRPEGINFSKAKFISKELHKELSLRCKPELNDVLYTKGGTTGIARVNTYTIDFNVWVHVAVLKPVKSIVPFYLQHALNSNHCYKQSQKYTHGVGNQDLGLTRMVLITLPVCSYKEQQQVVQEIESRLSVADKMEETIANSLQQAEALRQSVLKKAFDGELLTL